MKLPKLKKISYPPVKAGDGNEMKKYEIEFRTRRHIGHPESAWCTYKEDTHKVGCDFEEVVVRSDDLSELQHTMDRFHNYFSMGMVDHRIIEVVDKAIFDPS